MSAALRRLHRSLIRAAYARWEAAVRAADAEKEADALKELAALASR